MKKKPDAILITGATKRLGLALTIRSLELGYSVVAHYRTTAAPLHRWLLEHPSYKNNIFPVKYDLSDQPEGLVDLVKDLPVTPVGLVNNAAEFTKGDLADMDHFLSVISVNALAPVKIANRFSELVSKGWIINITDAQCGVPNKAFQNYRISKAFLNELTRQLACSLGPAIRVNALAPGPVLARTREDIAYFNRLKEKVPLGKNADVGAVLDAYAYLIRAEYVTGQVIYVDGGLHLKS